MAKIGLFPLNIVLFPGAAYPLHIFESRYKTLIQEVTAENGEFGVNLVDNGKMFEVGCRARVTEIIKRYDDGRMDIIVQGTTRYVIDGYTTNEKPYITADAKLLEDEEKTSPSYELLERTLNLYNQLVESVYGEAEELLDPTHWLSGGAAYRMAQKCGLELTLRQKLLEMRSETQRLEFLDAYLNDLVPKIKQMETIQMLSRNDGYVKPS